MRFPTLIKYTGLLVFGYLLLLSLSYSYGDYAYQAIVTPLAGMGIWLGIKKIRALHHKHGADRVFWGVLLTGGIIRFAWAIFAPTQPFSDFQFFHESAIQLAQGAAVLTKNMGYSLLLSAGYRIYPGVLTGKLVNAAAGTLSLLFLYRAGSKLAGQQTGLIASFLFAVLPGEILMTSVLGTEVVATTLGILTAFFIIQATDGGSNSPMTSILRAGLFYGLGLTVNHSLYYYLPAILLWIISAAFPDLRRTGKFLLTFTASAIVGLSVILAGYYLSTKQLSLEPLQTQDSFAFLSGTNAATSGRWGEDDANLYFSWAADERDALARQEALNRIRSNPMEFMLLIPRKIAVLFGTNKYGIDWSLHNVDWEPGKTLIGLVSQSIHVFILFFAFFAFKDFRNGKLPLIALIAVLSTLLPHTILEVQGRYHHYVMPFMVLLASIGIQQHNRTD